MTVYPRAGIMPVRLMRAVQLLQQLHSAHLVFKENELYLSFRKTWFNTSTIHIQQPGMTLRISLSLHQRSYLLSSN